ncbi:MULTISPECIES: serine O-acetyltransferase [Rhodomicrobium]|uniref:serine O-acetyltransferase n=1 Tax=Rhodomicrobium TaxID=1068 RepID=UPI000B4A9883|nr:MULTISPECIES: serine O-acetyltransferase [Rhodomicrobium]
MPSPAKKHSSKIQAYDPIWQQIRAEAEEITRREPALASFILANVLNHGRLEDAICHRLAQRLGHDDVNADLIGQTFERVLGEDPGIGAAFRVDLSAVADRDPACKRQIEPLLYYKGFHALETHRFAHWLFTNGEKDFALYLQSQSSRVFDVDIHPAARIGRGIMLDHATGIVIGETAAIGDMSSLLHGVTLGGSGKEDGDRHPKVGRCVMIGAGAKILGNITVGDCARVAAGSVVLKDVPTNTTVAGVPARVVGVAGCTEPGRTMNQMLGLDASDATGETER